MNIYSFDKELKQHLQMIYARSHYNIVITQLEDTLKDGSIKPSSLKPVKIDQTIEPQSSWFPWWIFGY
jgi:hypothetical protein